MFILGVHGNKNNRMQIRLTYGTGGRRKTNYSNWHLLLLIIEYFTATKIYLLIWYMSEIGKGKWFLFLKTAGVDVEI